MYICSYGKSGEATLKGNRYKGMTAAKGCFWVAVVTCEGPPVIFWTVLTEAQAGRTHQIASKTRTDIAVNVKGGPMT